MHIAWQDLQTLEAVVRTGTVVGAARELGLRHSSISRRIESLERLLATSLFLRGSRLRPTAVTLEIVAHAAGMASRARAVEALLESTSRARAGRLVLTTNDVLAPLVFAAVASCEIRELVQVRVSDVESALEPGVTDLALRPGTQPAGALRGRRLGRLRLGVYRARTLPRADQSWILPSSELRGRASMRWWKAVPDDALGHVECDTLLALRDACLAGLGRAVLPALVAIDDPRLVLDELLDPGPPVWLLAPASRAVAPARRRIANELASAMRAQAGVWIDT